MNRRGLITGASAAVIAAALPRDPAAQCVTPDISLNIPPRCGDLSSGLGAIPSWPSQGAVTVFDFSQPAGTFLENIAGWSRTGATAGAARVSATNTLDILASGSEGYYLFETGDRSHYVEGNLLTEGNIDFPLCVRVVDNNNFIGARIFASQITLYQRVAGTFTQLLAFTANSGGDLGIYRIEAKANDTVWLYYAGNLIFTGPIPAALTASTKIGMVVRTAALMNGMDDLHVYGGAVIHGYSDGAWSWWHEPRSVSANGKTWYGQNRITTINGRTGAAEVVQLDNTTGAATVYRMINVVNYDDDHTYPTILIRPDGRLICFYCWHRSTEGLKFRISVNPYDASAWSAEQIFAVPVATDVTYPSPVMLSGESNKVYVFYRGVGNALAAITSTDLATVAPPASDGAAAGTATWSAAAAWINNGGGGTQGVYHKVWSDGISRIDFACTDALAGGSGAKVDVRHFYWQAAAAHASDGTTLAAFPLLVANLTPIATSGAPDNFGDVWVHDMFRETSGAIHVVFARFLSTSDHRYYYARWNGATWTKGEMPNTSTGPIVTANELYYSPGVCLDGSSPGIAYAAIGNSSASILYRYRTNDQGVSWSRVAISPPNITGARYSGQNIRPVVPRNRVAAYAVLWPRGGYQYYDASIPAIGGGYQMEIMSSPI